MAHPTLPPSLIDAFHDRYELVRETGRGGSAIVLLAHDLKHDRQVAIKILAPDVGDVAGERFLREIRVSAGMQHPHILPMYDSGICDGRLYFVMPFVEAGSLRDRLKKSDAIEVEEALRITRDVGIALVHAHRQGIVHRDVKPENILFYHNTACLADFGIAHAIEQIGPNLTLHGTVVGTPAYMSPEARTGEGLDGRSDVYSLACVLYEMLGGARAFRGNPMREVLFGSPEASARARPQLPDVVEKLLDKGLAMAPEDRFPDAQSFVAAIEEVLQHLHAPRRISAPERVVDSVRRHKWTYAAIAAVIIVALLAWRPVDLRRGYANGARALAAWDIPAAQRFFIADTSANGRLWLAESYLLGGQRESEPAKFKQATSGLETARAKLGPRESSLAAGLIALAAGAPAKACDAYSRLIAADSTDVLAWIGLGECLRADRSVVRDAASPSGWRFSTSYHSAARALLRAVTLDPGAHAAVPYATLAKLLPADVSTIRFGNFAGPPTQSFAAYPAKNADTIAYVPYPLAEFSAVRPSTVSPTQPLALERNRALLLDFATQWTVGQPQSAGAWEALAAARDGVGELDDNKGAGAAILRARSLAAPADQARLRAAQVRFYIKEADFRRGRALADSVLADTTASPAALAGLAALTGHVDRAARHFTRAISKEGEASLAPLLTVANAFFLRAALGVCDDSLRTERAQFEKLLDSYAAPAQRDQLRERLLARGSTLAFPCLGASAVTGIAGSMPIERAQRAFAAGDRRRVLMILDSLATVRVGYRPGDISLDHTVQESWLRAAAGDSAGAIRQLDRVLDALPTLSAQATTEPAQSAAVGRAMMLRADLAAARGDSATARKWAANVLQLWSGADSSLRPTLDRMTTLTQTR